MAGVELLQLPHPDVEHLHLLVGGADADAVPAGVEVQVERTSLLIGEHVQALARRGPAKSCPMKSMTYQQSVHTTGLEDDFTETKVYRVFESNRD